MALSAKDIQRMLPDLMDYIAMQAAEEGPEEGTPSDKPTPTPGAAAAPEGEDKGGMGVVIALKPKAGDERGAVGKVPGSPDGPDGTPHTPVGK